LSFTSFQSDFRLPSRENFLNKWAHRDHYHQYKKKRLETGTKYRHRGSLNWGARQIDCAGGDEISRVTTGNAYHYTSEEILRRSHITVACCIFSHFQIFILYSRMFLVCFAFVNMIMNSICDQNNCHTFVTNPNDFIFDSSLIVSDHQTGGRKVFRFLFFFVRVAFLKLTMLAVFKISFCLF